MERILFGGIVFLVGQSALAQTADTYRYDRQTKASNFARDFFGPTGSDQRIDGINMGRVGVNFSTSLDCGKLDIEADIKAEFNKIQEQVKALIPRTAPEVRALASRTALMTTCYAYPTICAQLRHDFLSLQTNLNLRAQACRAMDEFIDSSADKGAKQLRAEAQAECVSEKIKDRMTPARATEECQKKSGLPLRDFQAGLEKRFTNGKQKVLLAIVNFSKTSDKATYDFLTSMLGEIEVQEDGYWQPLFAAGMLRLHDLASNFLVQGQADVCGSELSRIVGTRPARGGTISKDTVSEVIARRLTRDDVTNLEDLEVEDKKLACAALGRAVGQVAADKASAQAEAVLASGLLNTAIPDSLRAEYRNRGDSAFQALRKAIESDQIPTIEDVRAAISQLARTTREKNRMLAGQISKGKIENYRHESAVTNDCVDTLSCLGGQ